MPPVRARLVIAGRDYLLLTASARPRRVRSKGRTYYQYTLNIPRSILPQLLEEAGASEGQLLPLTVILTASPWHHLIDWKAMPGHAWNDLPDRIKRELEALGLDPNDNERILIPATREQLEQLDLDPDQPLTLEDLEEAIRRRLLEELRARGDGRKEDRVAPARASPAQR